MFAGNHFSNFSCLNHAQPRRQVPQECLQQLPLAQHTRHLALFSFRAPWCPVSLARLKTFSERLLPTRPDFLMVAVTLGNSQALQELRELLPAATALYYDRELKLADALGLYLGRGFLKPGVVVTNQLGMVQWMLIREAQANDWQAFADVYLTTA